MITETTSQYGTLNPKINNAEISSNDYTILYAGNTNGEVLIPYINPSGLWRIKVISGISTNPVTSVASTSISYRFYYVKNEDL